MKFGEHLLAQQTSEWHAQYIQYEKMKKMIYEARQSGEAADERLREAVVFERECTFFKFCSKELEKIVFFLTLKRTEALGHYYELSKELELASKQRHESVAETCRRSQVKTMPMPGLQPRPDSLVDKLLAVVRWSAAPFFDSGAGVRLLPERTLSQLKDLFSEYYFSLVLLQRYQLLNLTGFRKILKKHDKVMCSKAGSEWFTANVRSSLLFTSNEVNELIEMTEKTFAEGLEKGDRQAAMKRLRVPPFSEIPRPWTTFRTGFYLGGLAVLVCFTAIAIVRWLRSDKASWMPVRLFRGFFLLFLSVLLIGVNMYGWRRYGVNHVLIFELDPRRHLSYQQLLEIGSMFFVVWTLCLLGYLHAPTLGVSPLTFPFVLMTFVIGWTLNPLNMCARTSRYWLLRHLGRCFTAPLHTVTFADFWLADQMNSLVTLFLDFQYFFCFYSYRNSYSDDIRMKSRMLSAFDLSVSNRTFAGQSSSLIATDSSSDHADVCSSNDYGIRPLIAAVPALIRMLQCFRRYYDTRSVFPYLVNAGKYSTTVFVVVFGALESSYSQEPEETNGTIFYLWLAANVVSLLYTYAWDVKMDWGLLERSCGGNSYLREQLVYRRKWFYYSAMVADFFLRITWVLNVSLGEAWLTKADVMLSVTAPFECFRRFVWNYFRLENEHLNNCGHFRAVRDISLQPFSKLDIEKLGEMADDDGGNSGSGTQTLLMFASKDDDTSLRARLEWPPVSTPFVVSRRAFNEDPGSDHSPPDRNNDSDDDDAQLIEVAV